MGHFCPPGSGSNPDPDTDLDPQLVCTYIDLGNLARVQELYLLVFILIFEEERLPVLQSARPSRLNKNKCSLDKNKCSLDKMNAALTK